MKRTSWIWLVAGAATSAGVGWWLTRGGGGPDLSTDFHYLPDNAVMVASIDLEAVRKSESWREVKAAHPGAEQEIERDFARSFGVSPNRVERFTAAYGNDAYFEVRVFRLKSPATVDDVLADCRKAGRKETYAPVDVAGVTLRVEQGDAGRSDRRAFVLANERLLVVGYERCLRAVLSRNAAPRFTEPMQAALAEADFSAPAAIAFDLTRDNPISKMPGGASLKVRAGAVVFRESAGIDLRAVVLTDGADQAEALRKIAEGLIAQAGTESKVPQSVRTALAQITVSASGERFILHAQAATTVLVELASLTVPVPSDERLKEHLSEVVKSVDESIKADELRRPDVRRLVEESINAQGLARLDVWSAEFRVAETPESIAAQSVATIVGWMSF